MHNTTLVKASKDFFTQKFLFLSLAPFIIPMLIFSGLLIYGGGEFYSLLQEGSMSGDYSYIDAQSYPTLTYLLSFAVVHWLVMTLFVLFGSFGVVLFSLVVAVITVGFMTPYIVEKVRVKSYANVNKAEGESLLFSFWTTIKIFMKFMLILLCTLPFLLLPFVNFLILQLPFFYLFHQLMLHDLLSSGVCDDASEIIEKNRAYLFVVLGIFFLASLVPLVGLLFQVFFIVYLSHFILNKSKSLHKSSDTNLEVSQLLQ